MTNPLPFEIPVFISGDEYLCGADAELIARLDGATQGEIDAIVECINAHPKLIALAEAAKNLVDMSGRHNTAIAYRQLVEAVKELE